MRTPGSGAFALRLLGGLALERGEDAVPAGALQKRRLALLALLALGGKRGLSREQLQTLLWPDGPEERARHALEQLLYLARRDLGRDAVLADGARLRLNPEVVQSDLAEFEVRVARGDLCGAAGRYAGPLLDGVRLGGAPELERWVEEQRDAWTHRYASVLERLATAAERDGDRAAAVEWWRRRVALDPCSAPATLALMQALAAAGDAASAVRQARVYEALVRTELSLEPDGAVAALAARLGSHPPRAPEPATPPAPGPSCAAPAPRVEAPVRPLDRGTARAASGPRRKRLRVAMLGVVPLAAAVVLLAVLPHARPSRGVAAGPRSRSTAAPGAIAVLPLADMGADPGGSYFSDGLTEELMHALSRVPGLRVVARTSVFALRGRTGDVRQIGATLGVSSVLEGSVRRAGDRVRVNVRLVDAVTGYERWSESYDRRLADVLEVQREIAEEVASRLSSADGDSPASEARGAGTRSYAAFEHFLRGRYQQSQPGAAAQSRAVEELRAAVAADPQYARAHAALAEAYNAMAESASGRAEQPALLVRAEAAARRALDLDPHLADAHASLGNFLLNRWDWSGAGSEFRRAIAENPSLAAAYERYGILLALEGEFDQAIAMVRRAQELDPLSLGIQGSSAYVLNLARRYPDAEAVARRLVSMAPDRESPHFRLASVLQERGQYAEAIRELRTALRLPPTYQNRALPLLGFVYARAGRLDEAVQLRADVERGLADHSVSPYFAAAYFGAVGAEDRAFAVLADLGSRRESCLRDLAVDPLMAPLRRDPRFTRVLRALGTEHVPQRLGER